MWTSLRLAPVALAAVLAGTSAQAAITVYTSQATYLAALAASGVDTFEDFLITGATPAPIFRSAGSYGYRADVSTTSFFGAGSNADRWLSTNTATDTVTFDAFTGGVNGLGGFFFGSNSAGNFAAGGVTLTATDADGTVTQVVSPATTLSFVGFVSTGLLSNATITSNQPATGFLWPTINDLTLGVTNAVPEPATWAMMIAGFGLVGAAARRRISAPVVSHA